MSTELIIAGEMGKGGGGSTEAKDTLISEQTVKTLFAVGEGIIEGVDDIFLDTVSISSFDADYEVRYGMPSQTVISNSDTGISFSTTESPLPGFTSKTIIRDSIKTPGNELPNVSTGEVVNAVSLVANTWYRITSLGTTNFKLVGSSSNALGTVFKATGAGTGTGATVRMQPNYVVPTFDTSIPFEETLTSVRLTFSVSTLSSLDGEGNLNGSWFTFEIYTRPNTNSTWSRYGTNSKGIPTGYTGTLVKGKTTHGYTFERTIPRPTAASSSTGPWQVRVIRTREDSNSSKKQNIFTWNAVTQIYEKGLPYNNTALVGVILRDANQFGNRIPEVMFKVKGKRLRLPINYNPTTRTYSGNWDGTLYSSYNLQYTNNPAWILFDVLTDTRAGLGIPDADIDKYSIYNLGKYADEQIPTGYIEPIYSTIGGAFPGDTSFNLLIGGQETTIPRFTLDYSFQSREGIKDFLSQILSICNANLITNEFGQLAVIFQQRGQVVKRIVNNSNVIDGIFTYQSSNIEQRTNLVNVTYNNGLNFGRTDTATVSEEALIARYDLRTTDVVLPGCYYEVQAIRKARWALYTNCYFTDFVSFSVLLDGMTYKIGDLIRVCDSYNRTDQQAGIVLSSTISGSTTVITLDRIIQLTEGTYTFFSTDSSYADVSKTITAPFNSNVITLSEVKTITAGAVYAVSKSADNKLYRVTSISKSEDQQYSITALEFDEAIFDYIDSGITLTPKTGDYAEIGTYSTVPVTEIFVKENFGTNGTYTAGRLQVSWTWDLAKTQKFTAKYKLTWAVDDGTPTIVETITSDTFDIMNPIPGVYTISVWAVNPFSNFYSKVTILQYAFRTEVSNSTLLPPVNVRIAGSEVLSPQPTTLEFTTPELTLAFDYNAGNQNVDDALYDYLVEIWDSEGLNKLEAYSINPTTGSETADPTDDTLLYKPLNGSFGLPFSRNVNIFGGFPARTFKVKVYSRDTLGDLSLPITVTVNNPVPDFTSFTVTPDFGKVRVDIEASGEIDSNEYFIYRGTIANFTPSEDNLFYKGLSNSVALTTPDTNEYFYKCAISDSFGSEGLNYSTAKAARSIVGNADFITISGEQFFTYASGSETPRNSTITLTATLHGTLTMYLWQYWNGSTWTTLTGTAVEQTYILSPDNAAWGINKSLRIRCLSDTMAGDITIVKISDGINGTSAVSTTIVSIYRRVAGVNPIVPLPSATVNYNFNSGAITGLTNEWAKDVPTGTNPLYIAAATAIGTGSDNILATEWSSPVLFVQNGTNTATITLYQTTTTATPVPVAPNTALTYTFTDASITETIPNGWKRTLPTTGTYRWMTSATAVNTTTTDSIAASEWSPVSLMGQDGINGSSAAIFGIDNAAAVFNKNLSNVIAPSAGITLTTSYQNITGTLSYQWQKNGANLTGATSSSYTVPTSDYSSVTSNTYKVTIIGTINGVATSLSDTITIPMLIDGGSGPVILLSNENITFGAPNVLYSGIDFSNGTCDITAYIGSTQLTYASSGANTFSLTYTSSSATVGTGSNPTSQILRIPAPTGMSAESAAVTISISIRDVSGNTLPLVVKTLRYNLSRAGAVGMSYWLSNTDYLKRSTSLFYSPSAITLNGYSAAGSGTPAAYACRFKIYEDGSASAIYTSSVDEAAKSYTPSTTSVGYIKVEMYLAGGTTTLVDYSTIPVVQDGSQALTLVEPNSAVLLSSDSAGNVSSYAGSGTTIKVLEGSTLLTFTTGVVTKGYFGVSASVTNGSIAIGGLSGAYTSTCTVANHSNLSTDSANITYTINVVKADGSAVTLTDIQTLTKSKAGVKGDLAPLVVINGEQAFKFAADSTTPVNTTITLSAALSGGLTAYSWEYWYANLVWLTLPAPNTGSTYSLTYNNSAFGTSNSLRVRCLSGTAYDEMTIVKLYDGAKGENAITGYLTNESAALPADSAGTVSSYAGASGSFKVFDGTTDVTSSSTFTPTVTTVSGVTVILNSPGGTYSASGAMNAESASFTLSAIYNGVTINKVLSLTRAKAGISTTTTNTIVADTVTITGGQAFNYPAGNTTTPTGTGIVTLTAFLTGTLTTYAWEYWTGSVWASLGIYTSTYYLIYYNSAFVGDTARIRCLSGTKYDEMTIVKLYSGSNGKDAVVGYLTNETATFPADSTGVISDYTVAAGQFKVFSGTLDITSGYSTTYSVTTAMVSGLTLTINTAGAYSVSLNNSSLANAANSFTFEVKAVTSSTYGNVTVVKSVKYAKSKTGAIGPPGPSGKTAVRAYQVTFSAGTSPSYTTSTSNGTLPGGSWSSTQGTVGVNQFQWQIDGIADYSTGTTTWTNPYLSVFKVDTLAAFTVNTGALNVSGNLSVTGSGAIRSGTTAYNGNSGYYIGLSGTTPVMSMLNASGKGLTYDGSNVNFSGALSAATGSFSGVLSAATGSFGGTVTVGTSPAVSGTTMTGSGAVLNSNGTFAIGNSAANISFNGSTFTFTGNVVGTSNINANAVTDVTGYTFSGGLTLPTVSGGAIQATVLLATITIPSTDVATRRTILISFTLSHADTTAGYLRVAAAGKTWITDVPTRMVDGSNVNTFTFVTDKLVGAGTTSLGEMSITLVNGTSANYWNSGTVIVSAGSVTIFTGKR
jgi:hypothetical protein